MLNSSPFENSNLKVYQKGRVQRLTLFPFFRCICATGSKTLGTKPRFLGTFRNINYHSWNIKELSSISMRSEITINSHI